MLQFSLLYRKKGILVVQFISSIKTLLIDFFEEQKMYKLQPGNLYMAVRPLSTIVELWATLKDK